METPAKLNDTTYEIRARWGSALDEGFLAIPSVLLRKQSEIGLSTSEMITLLNVLSYWWRADGLPFPGTSSLAQRMGTTTRTIERNLNQLLEKGLLKKVVKDGRRSYDPAGLVALLQMHVTQTKRGSKAAPTESA